jgi:hypothetical protein
MFSSEPAQVFAEQFGSVLLAVLRHYQTIDPCGKVSVSNTSVRARVYACRKDPKIQRALAPEQRKNHSPVPASVHWLK